MLCSKSEDGEVAVRIAQSCIQSIICDDLHYTLPGQNELAVQNNKYPNFAIDRDSDLYYQSVQVIRINV